MRIPELWAGMGRAVNNIAAAVIANFVLTLLSSDSNLAVIILVLVLFVTVSVVAVIYTFQKKTFMEQLITNAADVVDEKERLRKFSEVFSFTERESEVFNRLVNTEDSIQMIAEKFVCFQTDFGTPYFRHLRKDRRKIPCGIAQPLQQMIF